MEIIKYDNGLIKLIADKGCKIVKKRYDGKQNDCVFISCFENSSDYDEIRINTSLMQDNIREEKKIDVVDNLSIEKIKELYIKYTKENLSLYLETNKMFSLCKEETLKPYTVTFEKQQLFMLKYNMYLTNPLIEMKWNASGEIMKVWTEEECLNFIKDMNDFIEPLVLQQQLKEIAINNCDTVEDLNKINLDY